MPETWTHLNLPASTRALAPIMHNERGRISRMRNNATSEFRISRGRNFLHAKGEDGVAHCAVALALT